MIQKILTRRENLTLESGYYGEDILKENQYLMEVKILGAIPVWFTQILSELEIYNTKFSKYGQEFMNYCAQDKNEIEEKWREIALLETIIQSTDGSSLTIVNTFIVMIAALILGVMISLVYMRTTKKSGYSPSFTITLIMLPVIISIIILLVGNNVARAFSLAGAFSLIRFRSAPGEPKDIAYVFFTLAVGLCCGMGYIGYAIVFTIALCFVMLVLDATKFAMPKTKVMKLKIIVPEDLNYEGVFDEVLKKYSKLTSLKRSELVILVLCLNLIIQSSYLMESIRNN